MTAVAAPYEELFPCGEPLTEAAVERLSEDALAAVLLARFRSFLACGYDETEALLLAVGYAEAEIVFVAEAGARDAPVLN